MNISYFLLGKVTVSADFENITSLLNLCMYYKIPYGGFKVIKDRAILCFIASDFKKLRIEAEARGIKFEIDGEEGIPFIFNKYKHRYGVMAGVLLSLALIFLSQRFIWSIDVTGNEKITSTEVISMLDEYGFGIGSYIPEANTDKIENKLLIDSDIISWISINIVGTHAEVQIREYEGTQDKEEDIGADIGAANLIAKKSGLIQEVRVYRGNVVVAAGKYVEKGELLVSGLYDSERVGFRYTRASGQVMARTTSEYYIEIPYEYKGFEYTGEQYYDKYLNFFDYSINISKNYGKEGALYDKIDMVENCCLVGGIKTPFTFHTVKYSEYVEKTMYRTCEEAEELAYFELSQKLADMAEDSIILRKTVIPQIKDDSFALLCVVVSIEDIAEVSEFEVDLNIRNDGRE